MRYTNIYVFVFKYALLISQQAIELHYFIFREIKCTCVDDLSIITLRHWNTTSTVSRTHIYIYNIQIYYIHGSDPTRVLNSESLSCW